MSFHLFRPPYIFKTMSCSFLEYKFYTPFVQFIPKWGFIPPHAIVNFQIVHYECIEIELICVY